jgi:PilZ domain-containing protein
MLNSMEVDDTSFSFSREAPSPPPDRRTGTRHLKILRVGTLVANGRRELCLIRNISAGGLMAHVYSVLQMDQEVSVAFKSNQLLDGKVVWIKDGNVGIAFDEPIDVEEMLSNASLTESGMLPRMPRIEVDWLATVRAGATITWVTIRDISQGGVKFESDTRIEPGQQVTVTVDRFRSVPGVLRWYDDGQGGISFNELIPFSELMSWLREEQGAGSQEPA